MAGGGKKSGKDYWGRRAAYGLLKDLNCALASQEVCQDMIGRREDAVLKAVSGLEGGVVASGSTCGVITGGALGLAMMQVDAIDKHGIAAEKRVLEAVSDYLDWFHKTYGTVFCRERMGLDFYRIRGQLRYLLPGDKMGKCFWHIRGAMRYLNEVAYRSPPLQAPQIQVSDKSPVHCATAVLARIREQTGIGVPRLEKLAFVFDGGVGYKGGICGALAGAVMGVNQVLGMDVRNLSYLRTVKKFVKGHVNLLVRSPKDTAEPFTVGRRLVERFRETAGAIDCRNISGRSFSGWEDFQDFIVAAPTCQKLFEFAAHEASALIAKTHTAA